MPRRSAAPKEAPAEREPHEQQPPPPPPKEPAHERGAPPASTSEPPPEPTAFVYSAKFICGEQPACGCDCAPVQPGRYATEINIHNYGIKEVAIQKRFIPVVLAGAPAGREPRVVGPRAEDRIVLPPQIATMDDCCRIAELLFGGNAASPMPITIGFLEITSNGPIAVTAVYTAAGLNSAGVSIDVDQVAPRRA